MTNVDIAPDVLTTVREVLAEHTPGRPVYVFGSRVTGLAQDDSDMDLAVGGEPAMTWKQLSAIRCALEDKALPYEVDVVDLHDATGIFRRRIEAEWVPLEEAQPQPRVHVTA